MYGWKVPIAICRDAPFCKNAFVKYTAFRRSSSSHFVFITRLRLSRFIRVDHERSQRKDTEEKRRKIDVR